MSIKQPDRALSQQMRKIIDRAARDAARAYGSPVGAVLVLVPFNVPEAEAQYISNVKRDDGVDILRKLFARWRLPIEDVPAHEKH
jgi:hypothetical protein